MDIMRSHARLFVVLLALVIFAIPSIAFAQDTGTPALQPQFSLPGVLSLTLGNELETVTLDVPAINTSATIKGLQLGPYMVPSGWESISLLQSQPLETASLSLAGTQLAVGGASSGYSTDLFTTIDLHPSEAFQASGTIGLRYDGLARSMGMGVRDGNAAITAGPVSLALTGVNTGSGTMTADTAELATQAGGSLAVSGLSVGPAGLGWDAMDVKMRPISFGNVLTISPLQVRVGGTAQNYSTAAVMGVALNVGEAATVQGDLLMVRDGATQQTQFALQNGVALVSVPGFTFGVEGMDTVNGMNFDTVILSVERAGLIAEMTDVAVSPTDGFTFGTATVQMQPGNGEGGFQMQLTQAEGGYLLTTTSLIPTR